MLLLLTDNPVTGAAGDKFGFREHAQILCNAISATSDLPLAVGVYGPWGSGKTSFINLCHEIFETDGIPTVRFNPWKYDRRDEVWHALIQTVLNEIATRLSESESNAGPDRRAQIKHTLEKIMKLSKAAAWLVTRNAVGLFSKGLLTAADADSLRVTWQESETDAYRHVNQFESEFSQVVDEYTGGGRLIILIDDLDRCTPDAAVMVLDSLKLFLGEASCVFVLAMDYQMISEAVAARLAGDVARGRQYLEKLIQFPYHLPAVRFESLFRCLHREVVGLGDDPALWELIEIAFGANPRRVRRFINAYNLAIATLRLHSKPTRIRQMHVAILLVLRFQHPDFFVFVQQQPEKLAPMVFGGPDNTDDSWPTNDDPELARLLTTINPDQTDFDFPPPQSRQTSGC